MLLDKLNCSFCIKLWTMRIFEPAEKGFSLRLCQMGITSEENPITRQIFRFDTRVSMNIKSRMIVRIFNDANIINFI